jgi:flagellar hook protein FlgE
MMRSMFAAISGLKNHQTMLDVTANDIANVNTIGYKSARTTFKDSLSQLQRGSAAPTGTQGGANPAQVGLGVQLSSIDNLMTGGAFQSTGNVLDVGIQGEGFFTLAPDATQANSATGAGIRQYTRAGNFTTNSQGALVTQDGFFVVGYPANVTTPVTNASPTTTIQIPAKSSNLSIGQDGSVSYIDQDAAHVAPATPATFGQRVVAGYLQISKFANQAGLERNSGNRWVESSASGNAQHNVPGGDYGLTVSGVVEMSNVDLSQSFTQMITAQRGFQANSRVISTSDEMLQDLVNLKR